MPVWTSKQLDDYKIAGHYGFSGARIEDLGSAEYTLVVIAVDTSGSVSAYREGIEQCLKTVARACRVSPRADNLMLRVFTFDSTLDEKHGFKPLMHCHESLYDDAIRCGGMTALYDACFNGLRSLSDYGRKLSEHDFDVNAVLFVITDGQDNSSRVRPSDVALLAERAVTEEAVESITTILVGLGVDGGLDSYLQGFHTKAHFDQYIGLSDADDDTLARLADFTGRSILAQSRALGTGVSSVLLTF